MTTLGTIGLARPAVATDRSALPVAGDDPHAKATAVAVVDRLGFDTVDAGGHAESWRFEPNTIAYLTPYASPELKRLEDLRSTPATPAGTATIHHLSAQAERTDQAERTFRTPPPSPCPAWVRPGGWRRSRRPRRA